MVFKILREIKVLSELIPLNIEILLYQVLLKTRVGAVFYLPLTKPIKKQVITTLEMQECTKTRSAQELHYPHLRPQATFSVRSHASGDMKRQTRSSLRRKFWKTEITK